MIEFLKPWRRKFGVVTLLMTCLLMAGWLRSPFIQDQFTFTFYFWWLPFVNVVSASNHLIIATLPLESDMLTATWMSEKATVKKWRLNYCGTSATTPISDQSFSVGSKDFVIVGTDHVSAKWCEFPYWSIVLPLTAFAAFLLLKKPKISTPIKTTELIQGERGAS